MANVFGGKSGKRFSIDDAFEEESESVTTVNIYGSTTERSPLKPKSKHKTMNNDAVVDVDQNAPLEGFNNSTTKHNEDTLSRDSDSFMHDGSGVYSNFFDRSQWCCYHPKVKDNWKTVLAAVVLLIVGTGLLLIGLIFVISPDPNLQGIVFIIAGLICFIPGSYHVVYIYFAVIGKDGYDFYHLPLFN
ncbi:transmembrane protein 134 [Planococcus citri]|uniref:transmembrane protein 134 n=1 Tax=Planococcus citri TaxID=170843 RepID=UPI0031F9D16E